MATSSIYISFPAPPGEALSEQGPGSPSLPTLPLGQGIVVGTSSNASATLELRIVVNSGSHNVDTDLASQNVWTQFALANALERLKYFIRQRGFILGSGGPGTVAGTSGGVQAQTIPFPP
jgi:hypothetical protein